MKIKDLRKAIALDSVCFETVAQAIQTGGSVDSRVATEFIRIVDDIVGQEVGCASYHAFKRAIDALTPKMLDVLGRVAGLVQDAQWTDLDHSDRSVFLLSAQTYRAFALATNAAQMQGE